MVQILDDGVASIVFSCTEREAQNYGRFLATVLADLTSWHKDEHQFNQEARGSKFLPGFQKKWSPDDSTLTDDNILQYDEFKKLMGKWHRKLTNVISTFSLGTD